MNHLEFAELESKALERGPWDTWIKLARQYTGHDLDGDQESDGYSLDFAHDAFMSGISPKDYADSIRKVLVKEIPVSLTPVTV